MGEIGSYVRLC